MIVFLTQSWTTILAIVAVGTVVWQICWIVYCRTFHPLAKIPGPFLASFSRIWIWRKVQQGQMHVIQAELHAKYGSLIRIAPNELACSDPDAIKELYRNQNPLEKSDFYTCDQRERACGSTTNRQSRLLFVKHLESEAYIDECSKLFVQKLEQFADQSQSLDLGEWLQMYAFDVIGELYFGRMFGFMESGGDYKSLIHSLDTLNPLMGGLAVSATYARLFIQLSAITSNSVRAALKAIDYVTQTAKSCVTERQNQLVAAERGGELPRQDMLQQLLAIAQEKGEKVDFGVPEVQYEVHVALFAGSDTTAIALRSVFYHLSQSPDVLKALLDELDSAFPTSQHPRDKPISYADAIKLPLLCATIKEAMRLHPSVGFTMPRVSPFPDGLVIDGVFIPPGYRVGVNAHIIQRHKAVFGDDADKFRPDRWLVENSGAEQIKEMDRCMLHFGAGTRTCIGKNISLSEMHKLIPYLLRNFDFTLSDRNQPWNVNNNFWFNKQTGLIYRVKRRSGDGL